MIFSTNSENFVYNSNTVSSSVVISISIFLSHVITLLEDFHQKLEGIDLLYVESFRKVVQEIINLNKQYEYIDSFKVLSKVFKRLIALETIDFR